MKRYEEALPDLNRANELDPKDDCRFYNHALIYQVLRQFDPGKVTLNRALQLAHQAYKNEPKNYQNTFNLAIYYLAAADSENAKRFYRDALNRGATASSIQTAIDHLEEFLNILPQHQLVDLARRVKAFLEQRLSQQTTSSQSS